ncbi:dienelactone hydrolase family protein [Horticoccus sp. 23ND18S-11]|uniref:dienelactone hydrolase family protein n=1 Tax=Horticoccus sp. 23ND18S-11 TaxID=3391832 RepID=UPI0039C936BB
MDSSPLPSSRREFIAATLGASALGSTLASSARAAEAAHPAMPPDLPRDLTAHRADLGTLWPDVQRLADANTYSHAWTSGRFRTFPEFQAAAREQLLEVLQYRPEPVDPAAQLIERVDCGDYVREKITFATTPALRVPAYVLVPKGLRRPAPAIVDLHSHGGMFLFGKEKVIDFGANHPSMTAYHETNYAGRPTATALVRRGYVVITIDAFMFGERRAVPDAGLAAGWNRAKYSLDDVKSLNALCRARESTLVKGLTFAGATWPGIVFWDDRRTIDYLVSRPDVDPGRIGCQGVSMGGYRALFLSALDPRIRAGCVVGFMSTVRSMIKAHLDTHSWVHFMPALHRHLDWPDVAALAAPRALLVLQCARDGLFPAAGMKESVDQITALYRAAGADAQFAGRFHDVPHSFTRPMQEEAFAWFERHLG